MSEKIENIPQQVSENDDVHNLSDAKNTELLQLLEQFGEGNGEEYESRIGELSVYWRRLLIELLKTSRGYKEELDKKVAAEKSVYKIGVLKDLSKRTVKWEDVKLAGFGGTLLQLRWGDKKRFESFAPSYYYLWSRPITTRQYKHYLEEDQLPEEVDKYVVTEKEICDLLRAINEYMKVEGVDNDGNIDYKSKLEGGENKILAGEYLENIAPELCVRTITKEGLCWENNGKGCRFSPDDGSSYRLLLKLPKDLVESQLFQVACTEGWNIL